MSVYFDIVKLVFFILTIIVSLFQLRLKWVISSSLIEQIWPYILPIYFIFVGLIIGYIIWYVLNAKNDYKDTEKNYIKWFVIGWVIWLLLSAVFYFVVS